MEKPRVVIADTDIEYLIPLQYRLIQQFFDGIDLEIITDENYFDALFTSLQKIDVLIVSDYLYSDSLQRHAVSKTFILTEKQIVTSESSPDCYRVYKYNNLSELINLFVAKSDGLLLNAGGSKVGTKTILISSANGGAGKTTLALSLSAYLSANYKKVLYLDAEELQSFQYRLNYPNPISGSEVYVNLSNAHADFYKTLKPFIRNEGFFYIPHFRASLLSLGLSKSLYGKIIDSIKKSNEYEYIIIDTDSIYDDEKTGLINMADAVVFVLTQNKTSVLSTNRLLGEITSSSSEKYIFICNKFNPSAKSALLEYNSSLHFSVSDYVNFISECDERKPAELARHPDIQKLALLVE